MNPESGPRQASRFGVALFWEFLQNLPLIAGFLAGLGAWEAGRPWLAVALILGGSVVGSLVIWATESKIVEEHREPLAVLLTNVVGFFGIMLVVAVYLAASWSRWWLDVTLGLGAGLLLAIAQDLAAGEPIGWGHGAALGAALAVALVSLRSLTAALPLLANVFLVTLAVTLIVVIVDYGPFRSKR